MRRSKDRSIFIALCVAPATILFFIFMVLPTLNVFRMSLFERGAYSPTETFVGLNNFKVLFQDAKFISAMQNTILLIVTVTLITFFFAILFAAILTREKIKGQNFFRVIFYIPNILSVVVIAGIFSAIYKPDTTGMLNNIFSFFAGRDIEILWKTQPMVIVSIIIAMVWQAIGYYMVMYMASMSAVPASLYESAGLDGAGRLTQFFQLTLPLIWTNIRTTLTFFIISTASEPSGAVSTMKPVSSRISSAISRLSSLSSTSRIRFPSKSACSHVASSSSFSINRFATSSTVLRSDIKSGFAQNALIPASLASSSISDQS